MKLLKVIIMHLAEPLGVCLLWWDCWWWGDEVKYCPRKSNGACFRTACSANMFSRVLITLGPAFKCIPSHQCN